ncbi:hypothetical protein BTJ40_10670 [Microbulbifer sp. A4B17]|uniref:RHS repeat domain-containing protein n=1 Tax=Microbulbifer sp. A4B17 TaxID=359370 RepID=UPI000D52CB57|nr:RHS repeat-associated core domain-containing protein [Microbulbifer sp. A4B17]AWF81245.1 hypothetical protein BTJ40_10670 [Microbulbifer sp. A4B17]
MAGNVQHIAITDLIGTSGEYQYLHRDHLGSIEKITDEAGLEILDLSFNPDGSRRQTDWGADLDQQGLQELLAVQGLTTKRGYTGHEHLDRTGLIHMNGRIYDPTLGRFLSPDPIVQAPTYSQNWNRYSYVFNNPLSFTDPSGFEVADEDEDVDPIDEGQDSSGNMEEVTVVGEPLSSPTILVTTYVIDNNGKMVLANPLDIFLPELSWTSTNEEDEKDEEEEKEECTQNGGCVSITVDANGNDAQKSLNPFKIIGNEFPQWWNSEETQDLRQGINLSLDGLSIPYKMLRAPLDYKDYGQLIYQSINGDFGEAGITLTGILAGKTTVRFMEESFKMQDSVINAAGVITSNSSKYVVEQDCFSCK